MRSHWMFTNVVLIGITSALVSAGTENWVSYDNQTDERSSASAEVFAADTAEKDYAWGDLNQDGWIDLVIVRKQPWSTSGRRRNVC